MSGSNNVLQWNPTGANMESDSAYASDTQRTSGAATPSIFTAPTANKVLYQVTTFLKAFGDSLATKGYTISDANLSTLAGVLANVVTQVDLAAALALYAPLANPTLTGTPNAPTPSTGTRSTQIATTAMFANEYVHYFSFPNGGYQKFPSGAILQWGSQNAPTGNGDLLTFPLTFPNAVFQVFANDSGSGASSTCNSLTAQPYSTSQTRIYSRALSTGAIAASNVTFLAIGY
jgi:hypothetical protein